MNVKTQTVGKGFLGEEIKITYNPPKYEVMKIRDVFCCVYGETDAEMLDDINFIKTKINAGKSSELPRFKNAVYSNHNYISKIVHIYDMDVLTVGRTEKIRQKDEDEARLYLERVNKTKIL